MKEITDITQATTVGTYSISNLDLSGVHKACSSVLSPVLYISHENIDDELIGALVKNSMIGAYKLKKNMATKDDWDRLVSESEKMKEAELYLQGDVESYEDISTVINEGLQRVQFKHVFINSKVKITGLETLAQKHDIMILMIKK